MKRKQKRHRLIKERLQMGITQKELGVAIGVTKQMISQIENGQCNPSVENANRLEDYFNIPSRELLTMDEEAIENTFTDNNQIAG